MRMPAVGNVRNWARAVIAALADPIRAGTAKSGWSADIGLLAEIQLDQLSYEIVVEVHYGLGNPMVPFSHGECGYS
jgi:predicted trehalose synthase